MIHQLIESVSALKNRSLALPALMVALPFGGFLAPAAGQGQVLFFDDFEAGLGSWFIDNGSTGLWHLAENGECLAVTRMGAYNRGSLGCDYVTGTSFTAGILQSPPILLSGLAPYQVTFDYIQLVGAGDDAGIEIYVTSNGGAVGGILLEDNSGTIQPGTVEIPIENQNQPVVLQFVFISSPNDNNYPGVYIDNVKVENSGNPGDFDNDLDVDADDYNAFSACFAGAGGCIPSACEVGDLNADGCLGMVYPTARCYNQPCPDNGSPIDHHFGDSDIDCADWQAFKLVWTGPPASPPSLPQCDHFGDLTGDGFVNLSDILCILTCFGGNYTCAGGLANADLVPCEGNGIINLADILAVLQAFGGADLCP